MVRLRGHQPHDVYLRLYQILDLENMYRKSYNHTVIQFSYNRKHDISLHLMPVFRILKNKCTRLTVVPKRQKGIKKEKGERERERGEFRF